MALGSVIGRGTVVRGNVRGTGALEVQGRVEGDVSVTGELVLGDEGAVRGNVSGSHVTIAGAVQGDVRATEAVMLERGARVVGDLTGPRIGVASGALVRGMVRTDGEPALGAARRPMATALRGSPAPAPAKAAAPAKAEVAPDAGDDDAASEAPPPKAAREAPPPPVVPALAKGAKAKKKKKE